MVKKGRIKTQPLTPKHIKILQCAAPTVFMCIVERHQRQRYQAVVGVCGFNKRRFFAFDIKSHAVALNSHHKRANIGCIIPYLTKAIIILSCILVILALLSHYAMYSFKIIFSTIYQMLSHFNNWRSPDFLRSIFRFYYYHLSTAVLTDANFYIMY